MYRRILILILALSSIGAAFTESEQVTHTKLNNLNNANIASDAAIVESKLSLNNATHANTNDPSSDEKGALAGTSGTASSVNRYVTSVDDRRLPAIASTSQGDIVFRSGTSTWTVLGAGTSGQLLTTQGASNNPKYGTISTGGLNTATGSATGTVANAIVQIIAMNDYSFSPNIFANRNSDNSDAYLIVYSRTNTDQVDQVGRFGLYNSNAFTCNYTVRWRYVTGSDNPRVFIIYEAATGKILHVWESEDPLVDNNGAEISPFGNLPVGAEVLKIDRENLDKLDIVPLAAGRISEERADHAPAIIRGKVQRFKALRKGRNLGRDLIDNFKIVGNGLAVK